MGELEILSPETKWKFYSLFLVILIALVVMIWLIESIKTKINQMLEKLFSFIHDTIYDRHLRKAKVTDIDADDSEYEKILRATDDMDGKEFEKWLRYRFCDLGCTVRLTPPTGDGGADLIVVYQDGTHVAVQAKKSKKRNIGVNAVSEIMRGEKVHDCDKTLVITNQHFTDQAKRDAKKCNVELKDRDDLIDILKYINESQ